MDPQQSNYFPLLPHQSVAGPSLSQDEVEKRIGHIQWCYRTGHKFLEFGRGIDSRKMITEAAHRIDIPVREAPRYKQFAREYTQPELDDQFAAFRMAGFAFLFTHYRVLMAVKDKAARAELALRGIQERLGIAELRRLKQRTINNPNAKGGRKPELLRLEDAELVEAVDRKKEKFCQELSQILNRPGGVEPDLQKKFKQLLRRLR